MKIKLFIQFLALTAVLMSSPLALAGECRNAFQVVKDERWRIGNRAPRINQLRGEIAHERDVLNRDLIPRRDRYEHAVKIYLISLKTVEQSLEANEQAFQVVKESIVMSEVLKVFLNRLKKQITADPRQSLANQIQNEMKKSRLTSAQRERLQQLVNAVARLEKSQENWAEIEKEIVQDFLGDRKPLLDGLFGKLAVLNQSLKGHLQDLKTGHATDHGHLEGTRALIAAAESRLAPKDAELGSLLSANDVSSANLARFEPVAQRCQWEADRAAEAMDRCKPACI